MIHRMSCLAALAAALPAQQSKVLPSGFDFVEGPTVLINPFNQGNPTTGLQVLIDAPQVTAGTATITGMYFRPSQVGATQSSAAFTKPYIVNAYTVPTTAAVFEAMATPYDPNAVIAGATPTTVWNGPLNLPANAPVAIVPQPFSIYIPFTPPYSFDSSQGNLLLMIESTDLTAIAQSLRIDAVQLRETDTTGIVAAIDSVGCTVNGVSLMSTTAAPSLVIGGSVSTQLVDTPAGAVTLAFSVIGMVRQDNDLGQALGMFGCTARLATWDFEVLAPRGPGGFAPIVTTIPLNPILVGVAGVTQTVGMTASGAFPDAVISNAEALRVGLNAGPTPSMMSGFHTVTTSQNAWFHGISGQFTPIVKLDGVFP